MTNVGINPCLILLYRINVSESESEYDYCRTSSQCPLPYPSFPTEVPHYLLAGGCLHQWPLSLANGAFPHQSTQAREANEIRQWTGKQGNSEISLCNFSDIWHISLHVKKKHCLILLLTWAPLTDNSFIITPIWQNIRIDTALYWVSWHHRSFATGLFIQQLVLPNSKEKLSTISLHY